MKYSADDIVIYNWAKLTQTSSGKWNRVWDIVLKKSVSQEFDLEAAAQSLSGDDFQVEIQISNSNTLKISVTTQRWGWEVELMFATYRMFGELDLLFGTIDTIQGQDRDMWEPWLRKKWGKSSNDSSTEIN